MKNQKIDKQQQDISVDNIYKLDGRVPLSKAIPFGLQHVLAMFVANLVPVLIVASAACVGGVGPADGGGFTSQHCNYIPSGKLDQSYQSLWE